MANFPFFSFPYNRYYYNYYNQNNNYNNKNTNKQNIKSSKIVEDTGLSEENKHHKEKKISSTRYKFLPINFKNPFLQDTNLEEPILEILGINLYLDDIIILGLLFFLYKENVQDEMLFLCLILLLLS